MVAAKSWLIPISQTTCFHAVFAHRPTVMKGGHSRCQHKRHQITTCGCPGSKIVLVWVLRVCLSACKYVTYGNVLSNKQYHAHEDDWRVIGTSILITILTLSLHTHTSTHTGVSGVFDSTRVLLDQLHKATLVKCRVFTRTMFYCIVLSNGYNLNNG